MEIMYAENTGLKMDPTIIIAIVFGIVGALSILLLIAVELHLRYR
jgi:hypothetical protein